MARPADAVDATRYFRGDDDLAFYNVGTDRMRALARQIHEAHRDRWSIADALQFADILIRDRYLDVKSIGIEVLALRRGAFTPRLLPAFKRWLAEIRSSNWATTDAICCYLIGPLLVAHPALAARVAGWARHPNMWVRRASIVGLIPLVRQGLALDLAYTAARALHADEEDLIQKAVGWTLREAGKADQARLERYLRKNGRMIPRTTLRYAIERMSPSKRRALLKDTRARGSGR